MIHKVYKILLLLLLVIVAVYIGAFFVRAPQPEKITWGVNFSQMQAEALHLDWEKTYTALLEDLGARHVKLVTQWDWVEGSRNEFYFHDIDWQLKQAQNHGAGVIYVVGMKTGRWPECHVPGWAATLSKEEQQSALLNYIETVVTKYKGNKTITAWQAENEPLFKFGECPWYDKEFLKKEVALIKLLDPSRPVIVSDSGEGSLWFKVADIGDMVGTTMYRKVWFHITDSIGFYATFPIPPITYWVKAQLVGMFFHKPVINVELQAEPWASAVFYDVPLKEQEKTMNLAQFKNNIRYAKAAGFDTYYLWGTEWMYWLKENQEMPEIWNEAKTLFIK